MAVQAVNVLEVGALAFVARQGEVPATMGVLFVVEDGFFGGWVEGLGGDFFAGADGVDGLEDGVVDADVDVVVVVDVHFPGLEPLQVHQVPDVLLLLLVVYHVPALEVLHQLLLHLLLGEYVETLPETAEIEILVRLLQPPLHLKGIGLPQLLQGLLIVRILLLVSPQVGLVALQHQFLVLVL